MGRKKRKKHAYTPKKRQQHTHQIFQLIEGVYRQHPEGRYGFIDVVDDEGVKKGYYVFGSRKKTALDGDTVKAGVKMFRGKEEAEIIEIVQRAKRVITGILQYGKNKNYAFVLPTKPTFTNDIFVEQQYFGGAKEGDMVGVEIISWTKESPEGKVVKILGQEGEDMIVEAMILEHGREQGFSDDVKKDIKTLVSVDMAKEYKHRKDLRNVFTFTIDGEDSKDLDDAISIVPSEHGGYILYVHIADVAHFVREDTLLDREAYHRSTSVYLADRVIPMLPPELSNNLCSLHPGIKKLTMTCEMHLSHQGEVIDTQVYESIIISDVRLTYKEVDEILNNKKTGDLLFGGSSDGKVKKVLSLANKLKQKLWEKRTQRGSLDFHFPETKIVLGEHGEVVDIKEYPSYDSNTLIEVFMVLANESVGKKFHEYPFLYRVHEKPKAEDIEKLRGILAVFHIPFSLDTCSTKEFSNLLKFIKKHHTEDALFLQRMILRVLAKAKYSPKNEGHFGLGLQFYSHFTSPIRRYPDLQIHRIIKEIIHGRFDEQKKTFYQKYLKKVGEYTSNQEVRAQELERKVRDYFITIYYQDKIGQKFNGIISGMISKGIFVELEDTAEGIILMKRGHFDEDILEWREGGNHYRLGQHIKVQLVDIDPILWRLGFEMVGG